MLEELLKRKGFIKDESIHWSLQWKKGAYTFTVASRYAGCDYTLTFGGAVQCTLRRKEPFTEKDFNKMLASIRC